MKKLRAIFMGSLIIVAVPLLAFAADDAMSGDLSAPITSERPDDTERAVVMPQAPTPAVTESSTTGKGLPERVETLSAAVAAVTQQMDEMQIQLAELQHKIAALKEQSVKQNIALITLAVLVLILGTFLFAAKRKKKPVAVAEPAATPIKSEKVLDDTQSEYDFMGSSEGIPAKLDLVRAYIAMEDHVAAREALAAILVEGNAEQCREANALLNKINK